MAWAISETLKRPPGMLRGGRFGLRISLTPGPSPTAVCEGGTRGRRSRRPPAWGRDPHPGVRLNGGWSLRPLADEGADPLDRFLAFWHEAREEVPDVDHFVPGFEGDIDAGRAGGGIEAR